MWMLTERVISMRSRQARTGVRACRVSILYLLMAMLIAYFSSAQTSYAEEPPLVLQDLIREALAKSPEILAAQSRYDASRFRIPQAGSLPDPMFMFGYQNEGWDRYTYGEMPMAEWMFSASQTFPFPGKRSLKKEMATRDSEGISSSYELVKLRTIERIKQLYYDLFLAYKDIDLIEEKSALFSKIEDAALARYNAGMGMQQEVLMAQTEKYMLIEKEEMLKQRIQSIEAMMNAAVGREVNSPLGRPIEPEGTASYPFNLESLIAMAYDHSPEIKAQQKMVAGAEAKVRLSQKEYYPDFTITAGYGNRGGGVILDKWSLTTTMNIPLYYRTKQQQGVLEAEASLAEARRNLEATKLVIASNIRDSYAMYNSAQRLMEIYKQGLIPKTYQDFDSALAGYASGKTEAITVINRLKSVLDFEILYWAQVAVKETAVAKFESMAGIMKDEVGAR